MHNNKYNTPLGGFLLGIENEWALVLSGGGIKGSYEIGVWQSLISSGIDNFITGVGGTSVGALNAALFVMGDYQMACDIWLNITQKDIFSINFKNGLKFLTERDYNFFKPNDNPKNFIKDIQSLDVKKIFDIIKKGTIKKIIDKTIDSKIIRNKNIKFYAGCTALYDNNFDTDKTIISEGLKYIFNNVYNFNNLELKNRCVEVLKKNSYPIYFDTNETKFEINDILTASSAFPIAFDKVNINNISYIDGGVHDNIPIKPLYEIGYRKFICIYLNTEQKIDKNKFKNSRIIEIYPSDNEFNSFRRVIIVDKKTIEQQMMLGFIDGMRILKENGLWV